MIHLLQIINRMLVTLEYTETEIIEMFEQIEFNGYTLEDLFYEIGVKPTDNQYNRTEKALPNWKLALAVVQMKLEVS